MSVNINQLKITEAARWKAMIIPPKFIPELDAVAKRLAAPEAKSRYIELEKATNVPWYVIAVIHEREASQRWDRSLAQGDPWAHVSIHVPAGRGPFKSFFDAGVDALVKCAPHAAAWKDWSVGGTLVLLVMYNGLGYAMHGRPSPYIWASSNQYVSGKYVRDGHYVPSMVDHQMGCAPLLARMKLLDPSIKFGDA